MRRDDGLPGWATALGAVTLGFLGLLVMCARFVSRVRTSWRVQ